MALPSASSVRLYRAAIADVVTLTHADLLTLWRQLDVSAPVDPDAVRDALLDEMPAVLRVNHQRAAAVAADFYDVMRSELDVRGRFGAVLEPALAAQRAEAAMRVGVGSLYVANQDPQATLTRLAGATQRLVSDGARQTIVRSALRDPAPVGWVRVGDGGCDWCAQYLDGMVRSSEGYDFNAHDHCKCTAVIAIA